MIWPFPGNTRIVHGFDEMRPVADPKHKHGAIDIGLKIGSKIIAPERGILYKYCAIRYKDGEYWGWSDGPQHAFKNYFYDMFGGILILQGESGMTHIFAHIYQNQLFNKEEHEWEYIEQKEDSRWPLHCYLAGAFEVFKGAPIGNTGNAGFSTAPHCHYEIHSTPGWQKHEERPNPEALHWEDFR